MQGACVSILARWQLLAAEPECPTTVPGSLFEDACYDLASVRFANVFGQQRKDRLKKRRPEGRRVNDGHAAI
jgi:hypothetical protein